MFFPLVFLTSVTTMAIVVTPTSATVKLGGKGSSSFSSVLKGFMYKKLGEEVVLYEKKFGTFGYVTEQWFAGPPDDGPFSKNARIRIYIDGEDVASIDYYLFMGQSASAPEKSAPWSTRLFGHNAKKGGFFNTFRIPFLSSIKITLTNEVNTGPLWYIVRGLTGVELVVGSFTLPLSSRLRVYKKTETVAPLDFLTLSETDNKSGMLFLVIMDFNSPTPVFLEGCVRAFIDNKSEPTFLSSGTEDFFLSAYYFDADEYRGFHAGLTYMDKSHGMRVVAYKAFVDDPIIFGKSFKLLWRNFEESNGPNACPGEFPANPNSVRDTAHDMIWPLYRQKAEATVQSYVWIYEWMPQEI